MNRIHCVIRTDHMKFIFSFGFSQRLIAISRACKICALIVVNYFIALAIATNGTPVRTHKDAPPHSHVQTRNMYDGNQESFVNLSVEYIFSTSSRYTSVIAADAAVTWINSQYSSAFWLCNLFLPLFEAVESWKSTHNSILHPCIVPCVGNWSKHKRSRRWQKRC